MSTADNNADWRSLYEAAVRETDRNKLAERIAAARLAILDQIEHSIQNPIVGEQCAMDAALRCLRKLAGARVSISCAEINRSNIDGEEKCRI